MNILLWVLQGLLAWLCVAGGAYQIFKLDELKKGVTAMRALPAGLWKFLGAFGCVSGVGLILPGAFGVMPEWIPFAALAVTAHSALITALYLFYRDRAPLPYSAVMTLIAAFVAYGRFELLPL